jgi:5'-nucleotidase / UDP-sugar diphosphatase
MRLAALAALWTLTGCVAYNADCSPDETGIIGQTETVLDLRHSFVRTQEAPIGNLITDSFYDYLQPQGARLALVNGGSIRDRSACHDSDFIDRGPIRLGTLVDILPFENELALVEITGSDLYKALEHSVARLGDPGEAGVAGQFLQVSRLRFDVDCAQPAQEGDQVGYRISRVEVRDAADTFSAVNSAETYLVATNTFLADGGDGYAWLREKRTQADQRPDFLVVASYVSSRPEHTVAPSVDGRIRLSDSCFSALP